MSVDIEKMTIEELIEHRAVVDHKIKAMQEAAKRQLIEDTKAKAVALGVSIEDLFGMMVGRPRAAVSLDGPLEGNGKEKKKRPAKYMDPVSGQTWSGAGRPPHFIAEAEAAGRSKEDFLIKKD